MLLSRKTTRSGRAHLHQHLILSGTKHSTDPTETWLCLCWQPLQQPPCAELSLALFLRHFDVVERVAVSKLLL